MGFVHLVSSSPVVLIFRLHKINKEYDVKDKEKAKVFDDIKGEIEYKNITFSYGDDGKRVKSMLMIKKSAIVILESCVMR